MRKQIKIKHISNPLRSPGGFNLLFINRLIQTFFGVISVLLGLFLMFALAFNGTVGERFVNYSFFLSGLLIIIFGCSKLRIVTNTVSVSLGLVSIVLYLPMVWQRFNYCETDIAGLEFDVFIIIFIIAAIAFKAKKEINIKNT